MSILGFGKEDKSLRPFTPSLAQTIKDAIRESLVDLHVGMPGRVEKYSSLTQMADIQPCLKRKYTDEETVSLPIITNVPIMHPRASTGLAFIHMPVKVGDYVWLQFSERSLDNWLLLGGVVDPDDTRMHHLSDAVAFPGVYPMLTPAIVSESDAITIQNTLAKVFVQPTGEITIKNAVATVTVSPLGTVTIDAPLVNIGTGAAHGVGLGDVIESRLSALESSLTALVTSFISHTHVITAPGSPSGPALPTASPFVPVAVPAASVTVKVST